MPLYRIVCQNMAEKVPQVYTKSVQCPQRTVFKFIFINQSLLLSKQQVHLFKAKIETFLVMYDLCHLHNYLRIYKASSITSKMPLCTYPTRLYTFLSLFHISRTIFLSYDFAVPCCRRQFVDIARQQYYSRTTVARAIRCSQKKYS